MYIRKNLISFFSCLTICCFSKNELINKTTYSDSSFTYSLVTIKENKEELKVYVQITPLSNLKEEYLKELRNKYLFDKSKVKLISSLNEEEFPIDIIVEYYVHSIRIMYIFSKKNRNKLAQIKFNNKTIIL